MERLQKVIAQAGVASRRKAEVLIQEGRVSVNGEIVSELGYKVKKGDYISVDGKDIVRENKVYYIMNKPKKTMCTASDEFDRKTIFDYVSSNERLFSVGRLDYDTSGVLILTNDGEFANMVIHPKFHIAKIYNLTINGILNSEQIKQIKTGIILDDGVKTKPAKFKITEKDTKKNQMSFDLTIYEGRNRQIKRMMEALGFEVRRLHRLQLGTIKCSDLRQGEYRILKPFEVKQLKALATEGSIVSLIRE